MNVERGALRPAGHKSRADVVAEWDRIAHVRHRQINDGRDLSFTYVLEPTIRSLLVGCGLDRVLDVGCGAGHLTRRLATLGTRVVAVDPSPASIEIAQENCKELSNVDFFVGTAECFARDARVGKFTTVVANMTLMACLDLDACIQAIADLMVPRGCFIASITHPWFWPHYMGYADADWFNYKDETVVESPFRISQESTDCVTTHVHRPLELYLKSLTSSGFVIDRMSEPFPSDENQVLYPNRWQFPRFLVLRALRVGC